MGLSPGEEHRWVRAVPVLFALHLGLFLALQSRPGRAGVVLWYVGPSFIAITGSVVLAFALVSALRHRAGWSLRGAAGLLGIAASVAAAPLYQTYPSSYDARSSPIRFELPLDGPVRVAWGGPARAVNYHVLAPDQRWAYDLLGTRDDRSHQGSGARLTDYVAFDRPVRSPAAGVVTAAHDGEPDEAIGVRWRGSALGNHVILEVGPRAFLFVAHLRRGTVTVAPGDRVAAGDELGRVGNSGNSSEPHVHVHLQDTAVPFFGEGIPFFFHGYCQAGRLVDRGMPRGGLVNRRFVGDIVERQAATSGESGLSACGRPGESDNVPPVPTVFPEPHA